MSQKQAVPRLDESRIIYTAVDKRDDAHLDVDTWIVVTVGYACASDAKRTSTVAAWFIAVQQPTEPSPVVIARAETPINWPSSGPSRLFHKLRFSSCRGDKAFTHPSYMSSKSSNTALDTPHTRPCPTPITFSHDPDRRPSLAPDTTSTAGTFAAASYDTPRDIDRSSTPAWNILPNDAVLFDGRNAQCCPLNLDVLVVLRRITSQ